MKKFIPHSSLSFILLAWMLSAQIELQAQNPSYQPVTIEGLGTYNDPCDYFKWWVRYKLPQASTNGGFIIQHVKIKYIVMDCNDGVIDASLSNDPGYFETWPVAAGSKAPVPTKVGNFSFDDVYEMDIKKNTKGKVSWQSTIIFVENSGPNQPAIDTNNWQRDPNHSSGGLLYTTQPPSFWANASGNANSRKHNAYYEWICCDSINSVMDTTEAAPLVVFPEDTVPADTTYNDDQNDEDGGGGFIRPLDERRYEYLQQKTMQQGVKNQSTLSRAASAPGSNGFIHLYPVPAKEYAVLENSGYTGKNLQIRIMSMGGQLLQASEREINGKLRLDLSSLAPGVYLLTVSSADGSILQHFKLIRQE